MKPDPGNLSEVADAVLEGHAVDWKELESSAAPEARGVILTVPHHCRDCRHPQTDNSRAGRMVGTPED